MEYRTDSFAGSEGTIVHHRWTPAGAAHAIAVLVHGYAEHGARYTHVAEAFAAAGVVTAAPDHLGHGLSDGERALVADFEHVVDDIEAVVERVRADHPGVPVVMFGHSMGGLLTARFVERNPALLAGAGFLGAVLGDWQWAREVLALPELPPSDSNPDGMSRDPDVCRSYAEDPLVYHGNYKRPLLVAEVACLDRFNAEIDAITVPVLCLHGTHDPFVPPGDTVDAVLRMAGTDVEIRCYAGALHELVNETNRDEVVAHLLRFLRRVT